MGGGCTQMGTRNRPAAVLSIFGLAVGDGLEVVLTCWRKAQFRTALRMPKWKLEFAYSSSDGVKNPHEQEFDNSTLVNTVHLNLDLQCNSDECHSNVRYRTYVAHQ
jgi:hypothetical protein